jgi:hypothetical protein
VGPCGSAEPLRRWRRAAAGRVRARLAAGLRGLKAGAGGQHGVGTSSSWTSAARSSLSRAWRPSSVAPIRVTGRAGGRRWSTSSESGACPTTESWRRAGRAGTTRNQGRWPGWSSTPPSGMPNASASMRPSLSWKQVRQEINDEVCAKGYDPSATPSPSTTARRSSTPPPLAVVLLGFPPGSDQRVTGTINAVRDGLGHDGFISRYSTAETDDGVARQRGPVPRLLVLARHRVA